MSDPDFDAEARGVLFEALNYRYGLTKSETVNMVRKLAESAYARGKADGAAEERLACADVASLVARQAADAADKYEDIRMIDKRETANQIAEMIRARGEVKP